MTTPAATRVKDLPGPRGLPFVGSALAIEPTRLHLQLEAWCDEYGPRFSFRLGPQWFVGLADADLVREIFMQRPDTYRRIARIEDIFDELGLNGVFSAEGERWKRQRRLTMPAFRPAHLAGFEPTILKITDRLRVYWLRQAQQGNACDVHRDLMRYTVDVTTAVAFGRDMETLLEKGNDLQADLELLFPALNRRLNSPFALWRLKKSAADRRLEAALARTWERLREEVTRCRHDLQHSPQHRQHPPTLLHAMLLAQEEENEALPEPELLANVLTFLLAGEDTTANTLAWILHYLSLDPELQRRLRAEVAQNETGDSTVGRIPSTKALPWVTAVAQEVLRMRSAAPFLYFEPAVETELGGLQLKPGQGITVLTRRLAMQDAHFSQPERFMPERWLDDERPADFCHEPKQSLAFGAGPRLCPGRSLAFVEIMAAVSMVVKNFEVHATDPTKVIEHFDFTMAPGGLALKFEAV